MPRFSDRIRITQPPTEIQLDGMNDALSVSLWNWAMELLLRNEELVRLVFTDYVRRPLHDYNIVFSMSFGWLHRHYESSQWYEKYNFIEFVVQALQNHPAMTLSAAPYQAVDNYERKLNVILERELSGYRVIDSQIIPITDKQEIEAIRDATSSKLAGPGLHINKALTLLGKKPKPDYENSIKESISAVESVCKLLASEKSGGLDKALEKLSSKISIHPALKKAMGNLYGYTSDESGVRHAILESKTIGFAEAKFMLVICSAFVNFVLETSKRSGLI